MTRYNPLLFVVLLLSCGSPDKNVPLIIETGKALDGEQKYAEAIQMYSRALELDTLNIDALVNRAVDYGLTGDHLTEIKDLNRIIAIDSTNTLAYYNMGIAQFNMKQYPEAIGAFSAAIQTKGGEQLSFDRAPNAVVNVGFEYDVPVGDIKLERGITYYYLDSLRPAYYDLTYCIQANHRRNESYYYRALVYGKSDMNDHACRDLKMAEIYGMKEATALLDKHCPSRDKIPLDTTSRSTY